MRPLRRTATGAGIRRPVYEYTHEPVLKGFKLRRAQSKGDRLAIPVRSLGDFFFVCLVYFVVIQP